MFIVEIRTLEESDIAYVATSLEKAVELIQQDGQNWDDGVDYCFYIWEPTIDSPDCFNDSPNEWYADLKGNLSKENPLHTQGKKEQDE